MRSEKDVTELADIAGVLRRKGMVQSLSFSQQWMKDDYKLLELSKDLTNVLQSGDVITIRGDNDDEAVFCTSKNTYELKAADTSNSLLLFPELTTPKSKEFSEVFKVVDRSACSCFSTYYEARQSRPKTERLRHLLDDNAFCNRDDESEIEKHTTEGLLSLIQASEEELLKSLRHFGALQIDGFWRVLEINYQEKAFSQILALVEEESWEWKSIPLKATCDVLQELYPKFVIKHCLQTYSDEFENDDSDDIFFCLNEFKVCQYYAEYILRPAQGKFNYHEFMEAWAQSVPDGMTVKEDYLLGIALTDLNNHPPVIWHFSERNLPHDPNERFNTLFKTRTKWLEKDIEPYIKNLVTPGQKLSALYLKYTRTSKDDHGNKIYNSKRPVT